MTPPREGGTATPGPWVWLNYPDGRKLLAGQTRAVIHCPDAPMTCDPADQRLIAAAPDLLAACIEAYDWIADHGDHVPPSAVRLSTQLRAAIAKAEPLAERDKET